MSTPPSDEVVINEDKQKAAVTKSDCEVVEAEASKQSALSRLKKSAYAKISELRSAGKLAAQVAANATAAERTIASLLTPSSEQTATAAAAFNALCTPGMGRRMLNESPSAFRFKVK